MSHPPAYELYWNAPRSEIHWETPSGQWVGIGGYDFADQIGQEVLKVTDEVEYEVWQPDLRADKIYSHKFESGLIHKLFPSKIKKKMHGMRIVNQISSEDLTNKVKQLLSGNVILHLHSLGDFISQEIIKKYPFTPKIIHFHGESSTPYTEMIKCRRNIFANYIYFKLHRDLMRNKNIVFVYCNSKKITSLSKYNPLGIKRIFIGCDFNYWQPGNRAKAKENFGISPDIKIFSLASRFIEIKQINKIIETFTTIDKNDNHKFKLIIAGHGEEAYENYLKKISSELLRKNKISFPGYLDDEKMLKLYQVSDLFICSSIFEGGPVSIIKALACETPVFCTRVEGVDDFIRQQNAGILVDSKNYKEWQNNILKTLDGKIVVKTIDREKAKEVFHWPNVAQRWIEIYKSLA
jgi:glycosyltransferase involved in cell wall biosynthesis